MIDMDLENEMIDRIKWKKKLIVSQNFVEQRFLGINRCMHVNCWTKYLIKDLRQHNLVAIYPGSSVLHVKRYTILTLESILV